ncbi:MAG: ABC transporter permease [Cyclobacteriaceae bacterium]
MPAKPNFQDLLRAEWIKLKPTPALYISLAAPLIPVLLFLCVFIINGHVFLKEGVPRWGMFINSVMGFYTVFILPLYVSLQTALINGIEHQNDGWKRMFAIPTKRSLIYLTKLFYSYVFILLNLITITILIFAAGKSLIIIKPEYGFQNEPVPLSLFYLPGALFLSLTSLVAFHHWLSLRFKNLFTIIGIGIALTIPLIVVVYEESARWFYLWAYPTIVNRSLIKDIPGYEPYILISVALALIIIIIDIYTIKSRNIL